MSTRQNNTAPERVPFVSWHYTEDAAGRYGVAVTIRHPDAETVTIPARGIEDDAERLAAQIRGALALAYDAGRHDAEQVTP